MVYSWPLIEMSTDGARGLSIPRLLLGMSCAKRRNDSMRVSWLYLGYFGEILVCGGGVPSSTSITSSPLASKWMIWSMS